MTNYAVISPVRDEEEYIERTLRSVISQTVRPAIWVIVDDGSTDRTGALVTGYANKYSWIRLVRTENRGYRKRGAGVVQAFYAGMEYISNRRFDYIVKLDGDLSCGSTYFEELFRRFDAEPSLGIAGGICYVKKGSKLVPEKHPLFHVRGATKVYRWKCFQDIGGLKQNFGWDTIDEVKANMLGWKSRSFPALTITHHRPTGKASKHSQVEQGKGCYYVGYDPVYALAHAAVRLPRRPYIIGSLRYLYGYFIGYFKREPKVDDPDLIRYMREQQRKRILKRDTIWK